MRLHQTAPSTPPAVPFAPDGVPTSGRPSGHATGATAVELGSKAETLERLKPLVSRSIVLDLYYFSAAEWLANPGAIIAEIRSRFPDSALAIRSSAINEDGADQSMAGAYTSCLGIDSSDVGELSAAVCRVIDSYSGDPADQVLVQPMLENVAMSGVIMTHDLESGAPYLVINYDDESGETHRITSGIGANKAMFVYRGTAADESVDAPIRDLVKMTRELESLCGGRTPLDIEFARTADGKTYLLQARRLAAQHQWNPVVQARIADYISDIESFVIERSQPRSSIAGSRTILGQMPDWNPAEIIGTNPRPLSVSLYRYLVTDSVWREARATMGYREVPNETLMTLLAGAPYIDVRNSFNSFLPAGLDSTIEHRLIDAWLDRLGEWPEFHDKVEFEVAQTVLDFAFDGDFAGRYAGVLEYTELDQYKDALRRLTRRNVGLRDGSSLCNALLAVRELERLQLDQPRFPLHGESLLWHVVRLLEECRRLGTLPFSIIARHAFMAESLLRSAVRRGALSAERLDQFKRSLVTVAGQLTIDIERVLSGGLTEPEFFGHYGHLRPGTYDIVSLRYDQRSDLFSNAQIVKGHDKADAFRLTDAERSNIDHLLNEAGLDSITPDALMRYADVAIVSREDSKFVFTRHLSDALELLARWGSEMGLSRDDTSYLTLHELIDTLNDPFLGDWSTHLRETAARRRTSAELNRHVRLGSLIRDARDVYVVPFHASIPNFVTFQRVECAAVQLDGRTTGATDLAGKVVCIENADPGFDWIFTRPISGLISKYGGANSHMTIRCAELGVPAAIGVGEQIFERVVKAGKVELNCADRIVRPAYG